ncbi:YqzE family protein [Paenibacillus durus]|uniref:YqzE family protein n=1 Tax=Paenibacillus durus TaxID=44251 RepID=A0A089HQ25_PAEDU|nr:YqzE family protein [Paenibacillus durus]AIQ12453.1 hypothetical protein PDUR_11445 [Paenibacillus durus]
MASDGEDLVKYITEKVVDYMESPRDSRGRHRADRQPWSQKWFGMLPLGLAMWRSSRKVRNKG